VNFVYLSIVVLIALGLYAVLTKKNLIKIVIGISIIESAVNLFLVVLGYVEGGVAPIYTLAPSEKMVLPTPQALTLTSIVIGVAVTALMLALAVNYFNKYGSLDVRSRRLMK